MIFNSLKDCSAIKAIVVECEVTSRAAVDGPGNSRVAIAGSCNRVVGANALKTPVSVVRCEQLSALESILG